MFVKVRLMRTGTPILNKRMVRLILRSSGDENLSSLVPVPALPILLSSIVLISAYLLRKMKLILHKCIRVS